MNNISIFLIKELREYTNVGILECKRALIRTNGNIQLAIDDLRKNGLIKSAKKTAKITNKGIILIKIEKRKKFGIILEINCETDFVSKNDKFIEFSDHVATQALTEKIIDIYTLQKKFQEEKNMLISVFDENINIRRINYLEGAMIGNYLHNKKIGVIISILEKKNIHEKFLKHIAMHIVANKPEYIDIHHIPIDIINHEQNIQMNIALQSGKSYEIAKKIIEGRMKEFVNEMSLMNQLFVMDTTKTVRDVLSKNNIKIKNFIRFELGENIKNL